ncbi:hypothetical protein NKH77_12965 [Streptomyces sp. M19]
MAGRAAGGPRTGGSASAERAPTGALRVVAECAAVVDVPLPVTVGRLRSALLTTATDRLGLAVDTVDLRVTELLDEAPGAARSRPPRAPPRRTLPRRTLPNPRPEAVFDAADDARGRRLGGGAGRPGVARLAPRWSSLPRPVRVDDSRAGGGHLQVEVAVAPGHRALDVARAVRTAVAAAVEEPVTVAVLVTAVEAEGRGRGRRLIHPRPQSPARAHKSPPAPTNSPPRHRHRPRPRPFAQPPDAPTPSPATPRSRAPLNSPDAHV